MRHVGIARSETAVSWTDRFDPFSRVAPVGSSILRQRVIVTIIVQPLFARLQQRRVGPPPKRSRSECQDSAIPTTLVVSTTVAFRYAS